MVHFLRLFKLLINQVQIKKKPKLKLVYTTIGGKQKNKKYEYKKGNTFASLPVW